MSQATKREKLPCVSRHTLVMTLLEGPDHYNGHCTCDRWSYRTADWTDLGTKWAWHYIAESERPDDHPLIRKTVRAELEAIDNYGGDCPGCGHPVVTGRTYCRTCEQEGVAATTATTASATAAGRTPSPGGSPATPPTRPTPSRNCGNCRTCDDPDSPTTRTASAGRWRS